MVRSGVVEPERNALIVCDTPSRGASEELGCTALHASLASWGEANGSQPAPPRPLPTQHPLVLWYSIYVVNTQEATELLLALLPSLPQARPGRNPWVISLGTASLAQTFLGS